MIVLCLFGGFGNQLFQYGYARYIARELGTELWLNDWFYSDENPRQRRTGYTPQNHNAMKRFELSRFNILCHGVHSRDWRDEDRLMGHYPSMRLVVDSGQHVTEVAALGDNLVLGGEFSSHTDHLFEADFRELLLGELTPRQPPSGGGFAHYRSAIEASANPVAVQVRRGDYVRLQHIFRLLGASYYEAAFQCVEARVARPDYFVFSDDIDQVREESLLSRPATFVETGDLVANFELARACRHIICANSTYSWWTAYCLRNEGKVVVMPKDWYAHEPDTSDLPPGWLRV